MNSKNFLSFLFLSIIIYSCSTTKNATDNKLFGTTWELEYLSGPRIAFEGLFPDNKPKIEFNETNNKVEGNNSCNGYSAEYTLKGNKISFGEPGLSTLMYCGDGEVFFLKTMKEINKYEIDSEGKLNLMMDDITMMRFKKQEENVEKQDPLSDKYYFKATGTEPFWGIEISENQMKLTSIGDSTITPSSNPILAMDANVKLYKTQTESGEMSVQIVQNECTNAMSGQKSPYSVSVNYIKDNEPIELKGCGDYITDYRLTDIWVLEKMNGKKITKEDFSKEFPSMEINSAKNTFMGFAGCNSMNGSIFYEKGLLRFTNIATTRMMCEPTNKENEFLKALNSGTSYTIANNRLTLSNPNGDLLVFIKTD